MIKLHVVYNQKINLYQEKNRDKYQGSLYILNGLFESVSPVAAIW